MSLYDWINPLYLSKEKILELNNKMYSEKYVKQVVLNDFFKADVINKLIDEIKKQKKIFLLTDKYNDGTLEIDFYTYKGEFISEFIDFYYSDIFLKYLGLIFGKKVKFSYSKDFILDHTKGGLLIQTFDENKFLNWHDDKDDDAMILFYINENWYSDLGGELELAYKENSDYICYDKIAPVLNTMILFKPTVGVYHRVANCKKGFIRENIVSHLDFINS